MISVLAVSVPQMVGIGIMVLAGAYAVVAIVKELIEHAAQNSAQAPPVTAAGKPLRSLSEADLKLANDLLFRLSAVARRLPDDAERKAVLTMLHKSEGIMTGAAVAVDEGGQSAEANSSPSGRSASALSLS